MIAKAVMGIVLASGVVAAAQSADQARLSLGYELRHLDGREMHIFYIHGIGADGPTRHDSITLRRSICAYLKDCTNEAGEQVGGYDYADRGAFAPERGVPALNYMGKPVWRNTEEWSAAAPFVVHYRLTQKDGPAVYVDELNWWPLVLALKCREIMAPDAKLTGPARQRLKTCSTREPDATAPGRFVSYDWIKPDVARQLEELQPKSALANRVLKNNLADWGFSDAIMALGPMHSLLVSGLRQLILKTVAASPNASKDNPPAPGPMQEFVLVSHSLGSYLIFSALNINAPTEPAEDISKTRAAFLQVLQQTPLVYFFANQVPVLELANLKTVEQVADQSTADPTMDEFTNSLTEWGRLRCAYELSLEPEKPCRKPQIVALSDASDMLTWQMPALEAVDVQNVSVKNAIHWLWLIENPTRAHDDYARDRKTVQEMLNPAKKKQ